MASFYLRVRNQLASKNRGGGHADYIAGEGYYQNKNEVAGVIDKNLPAFAKDFKEFLEAADKNERANGRSYRSLIIAIPKEATDKMAWASEYAGKLLGETHAYRLAFHNDEGNPHLHLTFSERPSTSDSLKFEPWKYFSRKNPKDRTMSEKRWLVEAKELYLDHIRNVCPDFSPAKNCGEVKIGPKLAGASEQYEAGRLEREAKVKELRQLKTEFKDLDLQINTKPVAKPQKTDAVRPPTPSQGVKAGGGGFDAAQFVKDIKHEGYFIAFLKTQAKSGDPAIGAIVDSLKRLDANQEFSKQLNLKYKQVCSEALKDKAVMNSENPLRAADKRNLKEMGKFINDALVQQKQEQQPEPKRHPEPPPNRHRPSLKPPWVI